MIHNTQLEARNSSLQEKLADMIDHQQAVQHHEQAFMINSFEQVTFQHPSNDLLQQMQRQLDIVEAKLSEQSYLCN